MLRSPEHRSPLPRQKVGQLRSDTRRNIKSLLTAVGEEVQANPAGVTLQSVAVRAGVGKATAYRYFSSLDDLLAEYMVRSMDEVRDFSACCPAAGAELFRAVLAKWVDLVLDRGRPLVQLRSRSGYLDRFDHNDKVITSSRLIWERPVAGLLAELGLPRTLQRHSLFLCNMFIDPREILDLHHNAGMPAEEIISDVHAVVVGAIKGWAESLDVRG